MVGESNKNVLLIQIDASNLAEFELSEFEISRVDCTWYSKNSPGDDHIGLIDFGMLREKLDAIEKLRMFPGISRMHFVSGRHFDDR